jgi:hypothetical protein
MYPRAQIIPWRANPRTTPPDVADILATLTEGHGITEPLHLRKEGASYVALKGSRRLMAAAIKGDLEDDRPAAKAGCEAWEECVCGAWRETDPPSWHKPLPRGWKPPTWREALGQAIAKVKPAEAVQPVVPCGVCVRCGAPAAAAA